MIPLDSVDFHHEDLCDTSFVLLCPSSPRRCSARLSSQCSQHARRARRSLSHLRQGGNRSSTGDRQHVRCNQVRSTVGFHSHLLWCRFFSRSLHCNLDSFRPHRRGFFHFSHRCHSCFPDRFCLCFCYCYELGRRQFSNRQCSGGCQTTGQLCSSCYRNRWRRRCFVTGSPRTIHDGRGIFDFATAGESRQCHCVSPLWIPYLVQTTSLKRYHAERWSLDVI